MTRNHLYPTVVEAMMLPRVIRLEKNLYAAAFSLMKLLPACFMLDRARDAGLLQPDTVVIETTSGTFGLALAILCNLRGYQLILVSDPAIDAALQRRLEDLSAQVEIVRKPAPVGGLQRARLQRLIQLRSDYPSHFWPSQYDNPHNPGAYAGVAEVLAELIGQTDCLVGSVGSGGSMCGTSDNLRLLFPHLIAIGVDTHSSVLFGHRDQKRLLRGLGNSIMPKNLKHEVFDEVHWVTAAEAFAATRALHRRYSLFVGPTSGASYLVALWWAKKNPEATTVVLFADEGYRYQDTVYNDEWLRANDLLLSNLPTQPLLVEHPLNSGANWLYMLWNRRTYQDVLGFSYRAEASR